MRLVRIFPIQYLLLVFLLSAQLLNASEDNDKMLISLAATNSGAELGFADACGFENKAIFMQRFKDKLYSLNIETQLKEKYMLEFKNYRKIARDTLQRVPEKVRAKECQGRDNMYNKSLVWRDDWEIVPE